MKIQGRLSTEKEKNTLARKIKSKCLDFSKSTLGRGRKAASKVKV